MANPKLETILEKAAQKAPTKKLEGFENCRDYMSREYDVDAYCLRDGRAFLFVTYKHATLRDWLLIAERVVAKFTKAPVAVVAGAHKLITNSRPLPAVVFEDGKIIPHAVIPKTLWTVEKHTALAKNFEPALASLTLQLETENVLNPGVFTDQLRNRTRLQMLIHERGLKGAALNLFSYTGAFTVAALSAGLKDAINVDLNARYLEWSLENAKDYPDQVRVLLEDARSAVEKLLRRPQRFDVIVIDPPTFARGKRKWLVRDDLLPLVQKALDLLTPNGVLFVSTNDAAWSELLFKTGIEGLVKPIWNNAVFEYGKVGPGFVSRIGSERVVYPLKSVFIYR